MLRSRVEEILSRLPSPQSVVSRHKKYADLELYQALANCMELVEVCMSSVVEMDVMNCLIKDLCRSSNNRMYVESASDAYQRVCRYVFHGEENNANTNRYAICLREAHKQNINSDVLASVLSNNGGVNRFYLVRPNLRDEVSTKCIRLDAQITHKKYNEITLRLKRIDDNSYTVVSFAEFSS